MAWACARGDMVCACACACTYVSDLQERERAWIAKDETYAYGRRICIMVSDGMGWDAWPRDDPPRMCHDRNASSKRAGAAQGKQGSHHTCDMDMT